MRKRLLNIRNASKFLAVLALAAITFTSCSNNDNDVFDKDPILRLEEGKAELQNKLVDSEYGWLVSFSPDGGTYLGEFNVWMDFSKDWTVNIKTDLDPSDLEADKEVYNFTMLKTFALSFPHGGKLHEFTSMAAEDLRTDFEFIFQKYLEDGSIEFEGFITKQKVVFRKATLEDKEFNFKEKWNAYNRLNNISSVKVTVNNKTTNFNWGFIGDWRSAQIGSSATGYLTETSVVTFNALEDGTTLKLIPELTLSDGSTINELVWKNSSYYGESETNSTIVLK